MVTPPPRALHRPLLALVALATSVLATVACGAGDDGGGTSSGDGTGTPGDSVVTGAPIGSDGTGDSTGSTSGNTPGSSGSTGGTSSGAASSSGSSGTPTTSSGGTSGSSTEPTVAGCSKAIGGASGKEEAIPVCCTPSAAQKAELTTLFGLLNAYRAQNGKAALAYDDALEASIQGHCEHMRLHGFFDHISPEADVKDPFKRAPLCGSTANAENLAAGQATPAAAMSSWKASAGHNANMLGNWKRVGLCRSGSAWGQVFGN